MKGHNIFGQLITKKLEYIQDMIPHRVFSITVALLYSVYVKFLVFIHSEETIEQK